MTKGQKKCIKKALVSLAWYLALCEPATSVPEWVLVCPMIIYFTSAQHSLFIFDADKKRLNVLTINFLVAGKYGPSSVG